MQVLITGGGGFLGQKLAAALVANPLIAGKPVSGLTLADLVAPSPMNAPFPVECVAADISDASAVNQLFSTTPDVIYHLAAVVSGAAEADFDLGMRVNLGGTMNVLETARQAGNVPIVIFASSVAAHGGEAPEVVTDGVELNPQSSYGTQKVIGEKLLQDYSRKGFIDGRGVRLPTVTIRPGVANAAASSFMSSIFRDTMQGESANCPVSKNFKVWHSAPRTIIGNLLLAAGIPAVDFGYNRCINLPGRTDTIGDMIGAMTSVAGPAAEARISWKSDPAVEAVVGGWRAEFKPKKALAMGFIADKSFEDTVCWFLKDDIVNK
ncbi:MAG: NAD-dependent dehydratase [Rhodobacteraceae bacterium]|nr:MAG: NAD-dependent dehydratase [Paracoccaceae bacterium]